MGSARGGEMIRAEGLVKVYDPSHPEVQALAGVSFVLPPRGMVFVVGKSGSGKSTLMNILGGLDRPTSGEVFIDGRPLSKMSAEEVDAFRGEKIGFVFQDFLLFDDMTAERNVGISLDLAGEEDGGRAAEALERMDMSRFRDRKPKQLSAGQKQRVAIARALVKHPKIVLADEPTGNIDAENTELVLDTLKRLSEDALVIAISHSESDAQRYADRIIRLADGRIVSDTVKNADYTDTLDISEGEALLPARALTREETDRLGAAVRESGGALSVAVKEGGFVPAEETEDEPGAGEWKSRRMRPAAFFKQSFTLLKKGGIGKAVVFVLMGLLLALFAVAQNFATFDKTALVTEYAARTSENGIIMRMGRMTGPEGMETFKDDLYVAIFDDDLAALRELYDGEVFEMYSVETVMNDPLAVRSMESWLVPSSLSVFSNVYATDTSGVLVCTEDYLKRLFSDENGKLNFIAGDLGEDGAGIIVTDYVLDAYIYHGYITSAEALLGLDYGNQRVDIAGVIKTGYKEKYAALVSEIAQGRRPNGDTPLFKEFVYDVNNYLNLCYSVNPNWKEAYVADYDARVGVGFAHYKAVEIAGEGGEECSREGGFFYYSDGVADGEAWLNYNIYNSMFGTAYTDVDCEGNTDVSGEGHSVSVKYTARDGTVSVREYRIVGLEKLATVRTSKTTQAEDKARSVQVLSLYLTDTEKAIGSIEAAEDLLFYPVGDEVKVLLDIASVAELLAELLGYIAAAAVVLMLLMVGLSVVLTLRGGMFEIGMLRALGCSTAKVGSMFLMQVALMCVVVCVIGAAGGAIGTAVADDAVVAHFEEAYPVAALSDLSVAEYDSAHMAADCAVAVAVLAASGILPVLAVRRVDPVKIIRAKE